MNSGTKMKYRIEIEFANGEFAFSDMNGKGYLIGSQSFVGSGTYLVGNVGGHLGSQFTLRFDGTDNNQLDVNLYDLVPRGNGGQRKIPVDLPPDVHHPPLVTDGSGAYYCLDLQNESGPILKAKVILLNSR